MVDKRFCLRRVHADRQLHGDFHTPLGQEAREWFQRGPPNKAWKEQRKFQGLSGLGTHKRDVCKRTCLDRCVTDVQKEV